VKRYKIIIGLVFIALAVSVALLDLTPLNVAASAGLGYSRRQLVLWADEAVAEVDLGNVVWSENARGESTHTVNIPEAGSYAAVIHYTPTNDSVEEIECSLTVNGQTIPVTLRQSYTYDAYPFVTDTYGDQIRPKLNKQMEASSMAAYDANGSSASPWLFDMQAGENQITLTSLGGSVSVQKIEIAKATELPDYQSYLTSHAQDASASGFYQTIEAESAARMSARTIQLSSLSEAGLTPETYGARMYNAVGGRSWQYPGQTLQYKINVPEDGLYQLAFKYIQNVNSGLDSYRSVLIDGQVPFSELLTVAFPYTTSWSNKILGDETPYSIYLSKGEHTLELTCVNEPYYAIYEALIKISEKLQALDINIKGVTGLVTDKQVDTYKIYDLIKYIPDLSDTLTALSNEVSTQLSNVCAMTGSSPERFDVLRYEASNLLKFAETPDLITKSFDSLTRTQTNITTFAVSLNDQPVIMDSFTLKSSDGDFKSVNVGFFQQFVYFFKQLIASFTDDRGSSTVATGEAVEVWVQRNRDYVNLMQQHADAYFTPQTGIEVNVNYIPGQDILILANSAGTQPAVVSGIGRDVPFNFALRNAIAPLDTCEGYDELAAIFPKGQMVPYHFTGHDYALPEEVIFNVLFYRQDIFNSYNLSVPHTWEDSQKMVSTLQQNYMNFWLQWGDWITFYYQMGMEPYSEDGLEVLMDNEQGFAIFKYWSELYTRYNFPQRIGSFYQNFRYGTIPVGVSSLQDYFLLKLAAPELTGVWRIAPIPGTVDSTGDIVRYQSGDQRGVMLFKTDDEREAAGWEFIKWWMDTETQTNYALDLESAFGQEFRWFSGNPEVVKKIPWDEIDKQVILTQLAWFKGIPYTPGGSYMLEREMKNALSSVVIDKKNYRDMLEEATKATRKEMDKTLKEFGFLDEQGNVLKTMDILKVPKPEITEQ
jgi:ABC-type glycerol-3-phosphate transport system substrate-binding protein